MRILLALVLLGSLLSGCTAMGSGPDLMTAKQALVPAERAAERWADDAVLLDAESQELDDEARREARDEFDDDMEELREARDDGDLSESDYDNITRLLDAIDLVLDVHDGDVGDGRASLWGFTFSSESEQDVYMVAVGEGRVVYKESMRALFGGDEFDWDDFMGEDALGEWRVDSDEATAAANLDEDYQRICGSRNVVSFMSLSQGEEGPVWNLGASSETGGEDDDGDYTSLSVDAVNGSLIVDESDVFDPFEDLLFQESGRVEGAFQAGVDVTQAGEFLVGDDRHLKLALHARVQPPPLQPVTITVTDPEGRETQMTLERGAAPFVALADALIDGVPVGTYAVEVNAQLALSHDWTLYWCTDGAPVDQDDLDNPACEQVMSPGGGDVAPRAETLSRMARWLGAWQP